MINMKDDLYLLFYNVFGVAVITADKITVSLNVFKDGKIRGRTLEHELETPLQQIPRPVILPFGAWVEEEKSFFTPGRLDDYDAEAFELNKEVITRIMNSALDTVKGAVSR
jgi:hypothetical protein